ncbi:MAG: acyl dehydratase [Pseudomonadota bacterium]
MGSGIDVLHDMMDPARACAMQATLGYDPDITSGSELPPFFHQLYFWTPQPPDALGRDGHPKTGVDLIPDLGLPRRMWAGGRLRFQRPLIAGLPAERRSVVDESKMKTGRTGQLGFVTVRHEIQQNDRLCLIEFQDLVYRSDPAPSDPDPSPPAARRDETDRREFVFDTTLLFRYSALTFNGHRIHYDLSYAHDVEGYGGLVVHGPLLAQMLMLMAVELNGPLGAFDFRATSALLHTETAEFCRAGSDLWVRGPDGRQCLQATAHST